MIWQISMLVSITAGVIVRHGQKYRIALLRTSWAKGQSCTNWEKRMADSVPCTGRFVLRNLLRYLTAGVIYARIRVYKTPVFSPEIPYNIQIPPASIFPEPSQNHKQHVPACVRLPRL